MGKKASASRYSGFFKMLYVSRPWRMRSLMATENGRFPSGVSVSRVVPSRRQAAVLPRNETSGRRKNNQKEMITQRKNMQKLGVFRILVPNEYSFIAWFSISVGCLNTVSAV